MVRVLSGFALLSLLPFALAQASDAFIKETLDMHNAARSKHGADPLTWDPKLAEYSEQHAKDCKFEHTQGPYGECLAAGTALTMTQAVDMWMAEAPKYKVSVGFSMDSGHFTQVVWKSTKRVGCALITTCTGAQLGLARRDEIEIVDFHPDPADDGDGDADEVDDSKTASAGTDAQESQRRPDRYRHHHNHHHHHGGHRHHKHRHGRRPVKAHRKHKHRPAASAHPIETSQDPPVKAGSDGGATPEASSDANETPDLGGINGDGTGWGYIMCEYDPPGNYEGQFALEVQI